MHKSIQLLYSKSINPYFDDGGAGDGGAGDGGAGEVTFTKAQLEAEVQKATQLKEADFKKHQQKTLDELNALKAKSTLTGEEREDMESRIEQLNNELLTKEELALQEKEKSKKKYESDLNKITEERDNWKTKYTDSTIIRSITDAAAVNDAFNPSQVVALLRDKASLVEALDSEGRPTGNLVTKVKFQDIKDGKTVELDLSPADAVKRMTDMDPYLNLFKGKGTGGTGGTSGNGGGKINVKDMTPAQYKEYRKSHLGLN